MAHTDCIMESRQEAESFDSLCERSWDAFYLSLWQTLSV